MTGKRSNDSKMGGMTRKRNKIDLQKKIELIKKYEQGQTLSSIAREFGLAASTVNTILKDSARIKEHVKGSAPLQSLVITKNRCGAIYEMEKLLTLWMENQIKKCSPLSLMAIQSKARSIYEDIKGKYKTSGIPFKASNGWFHRFKTRAGFHNVKVSGEAASANSRAAEDFPDVLRSIIDEGSYTAQQIFNADETGLFWKRMPDRTYISKEEKTMPGFKAAKDRLTILLGANAAGDYKLKPLVVYRYENPRAFKGINKTSLPVYFRSNSKAWVTINLFEDWFSNFFVPDVEKYCKEEGIPFNILLLLDNAPGHPIHLSDLHPNIKVVFLPPNTTSLIQPMDQGIISNFKAYYLRNTFSQALAATENDTSISLREFWKSYNIYQGIINIAKAWQEVTQNSLSGVWKKICPQFALGFKGFEEAKMNEEVADKIVTLAVKLDLDINHTDVEELIESHEEELTNEDLIELEEMMSGENTTESLGEIIEEPKDGRGFKTKDMALAFHEISAAMARFERMDPDTARFSKVSRGVSDALACYKEVYEEKKRVTVQSSLDKYVKKIDQFTAHSIPQPSTSAGVLSRDDADDVEPISPVSSSSES